MADLTFADSHSMVAYMEKLEDNADFAEIVDFLNASPIRYALTVSPTIYVSYIEQFWSTAKTKTVNNETQIRARVDGKTIVITESSMRRDLHFDDEDDITAQTRFETASKQSNDPPLSRVNTLGSGEDRLKLKELMDLCTKLSNRVLDLETTKTTQAKEITSLKKIVKKLERKRKSKTLGMNLFKIGTSRRRSLGKEDASKQRRNLKQRKHSSIFKESDFDDEGFDADIDKVFKDIEGDAEQVISVAVDEVPTGDAVNTTGTEVNAASTPVTTACGSKDRAEGSETRAEGSSKRAGEDLQQESAKKQKMDDDKEKEELKQCFEIVPDDGDDVTIDATPLFVKIPINFDREDLEVLWRIVKARFKKTNPVDYMDIFLHLNLKNMSDYVEGSYAGDSLRTRKSGVHDDTEHEYTQVEVQQFRDTLIQHMKSVKKSIDERALHKREYDSRVNGRQMQKTEAKVDTSKALDASLAYTKNSGT
ncbi:hypothetical protein Tco_0332502 [Tanacetum coccineum]